MQTSTTNAEEPLFRVLDIIQSETLFDFIQKARLDKAPQGKIEIPLDVVVSLLKPEELQKLRNYITQYLDGTAGT